MAQRSSTNHVDALDATPPSARSATHGGTFAAFTVPHYARLWASGWLWNMTRWMSVFLCSYLVNRLTHSPLLVQLVGAAFFAPMFLAGALGGVISDRFDRRRTILTQLLFLIPIALLMSIVVGGGAIQVWMVYPFMVAVGIGGVIDMTSRRALVWDFVGEERVTNALALESLSMTGGNMLGSIMGGAIITIAGIGQAFFLIALCYAGSFLLLLVVPVRRQERVREGGDAFVAQLTDGFRLARRDATLVSILGVTILMNLFYFSYTPLVPVFADRLDVNALLAGVLASASGLGSMVGSYLIAARQPHRRGIVYVLGAVVALAFLFLFAAFAWYPAALVALMLAGLGTAGFATMQSVLVMSHTGPSMRGRAMGLLSMAIGTLPFGMVLVGLLAQPVGAPIAVMCSAAVGLIAMALWNLCRPEARWLR